MIGHQQSWIPASSRQVRHLRGADIKGLPKAEDKAQQRSTRKATVIMAVIGFGFVLVLLLPFSELLTASPAFPSFWNHAPGKKHGNVDISHHWGQYSPFFSLAKVSEISPAVPKGCRVEFVQVLSRHGARYPTARKSEIYAELVQRIKESATEFKGDYAFLRDYEYRLGADNLTRFGEEQMLESGRQFYKRYREQAREIVPFVRASGSARVIASAELFNRGFQDAKDRDPRSNKDQTGPVVNVVISEETGSNNTLDGLTCPAAENEPDPKQPAEFLQVFGPRILKKITAHLPGVNLTLEDVPLFMDLCPFDTVAADPDRFPRQLSPFCNLFTPDEWMAYDYHYTLDKYYSHGGGSAFGATRGVGFVNELIARMTGQLPVKDYTTVNHTLDDNPVMFPLGAVLYADFSHDNTMMGIYTAMGLYNGTKALSTSKIQAPTGAAADGYAASWTVPFAARAYVELLQCGSGLEGENKEKELFVRVLVNDRVVPLHGCRVDRFGRCRRDDWIEGLTFARQGGHWDRCFE
ncbi:hypothetical protein VTN31DRAFT_2995 [Thermomyces dupontii]|uniref:uncharacterized protein n=1 Tax=Talaromyces thermophilus TaxID=28565 RepID=UPI0037430462